MRQACCLQGLTLSGMQCLLDNVPTRQIEFPLLIDDILYLQEIFLLSGLHHLLVPDLVKGRIIVTQLLQALNYYNDIACLTHIVNPPLKNNVTNIGDSLAHYCGNDSSSEKIEEFFLENYYADFIWIEFPQDLRENPFIMQALRTMLDLEIVRRTPIVAFSYQVHS